MLSMILTLSYIIQWALPLVNSLQFNQMEKYHNYHDYSPAFEGGIALV